MADAKHTPGPWATHTARDGSGDIGIKAPGPVNVHAEVFAEFWAKGDYRREEAEANARLIAAAPDLLERLKIVTDTLASLKGEEWETIKRARAAIAKAEGR